MYKLLQLTWCTERTNQMAEKQKVRGFPSSVTVVDSWSTRGSLSHTARSNEIFAEREGIIAIVVIVGVFLLRRECRLAQHHHRFRLAFGMSAVLRIHQRLK